MKTFQLRVLLALLMMSQSVLASGSGDNNGVMIIDNTSAGNQAGIISNLFTGDTSSCSEDAAIRDKACNSIDAHSIQVMNAGGSTGLQAQIGIENPNVVEHSRWNTSGQLNHFNPDIFDMDKFRRAADRIAQRQTGLRAGTYGTISFEQFINNIARAKPMYGIVRVQVPLEVDTETSAVDDGTVDHSRSDSSKSSGSTQYSKLTVKTSTKSGNKKKKYRFCKKKTPTEPARCGCTPDEETEIEPGHRICGIDITENARLIVYGALLIDWVDCDSKELLPVSRDELPENAEELEIAVEVPVLINPSDANDSGAMRRLDAIAALSPNAPCANGKSCVLDINATIPFELADSEQLALNGLDKNAFEQLPKARQYQLLMPSAYSQGWLKAFSKLGIDQATWRSWGFQTPSAQGSFNRTSIDSEQFEDIPAYMYTGGMVSLQYHINISGLVYVPQAMQLQQDGYEAHIENPSASRHEDTEVEFVSPAKQYIRGAIMVRDAFSFEADDNGITLISNDPTTYTNIKLNNQGSQARRFQPLRDVQKLVDSAGTNDPGTTTGSGLPTTDQWVEIKPM